MFHADYETTYHWMNIATVYLSDNGEKKWKPYQFTANVYGKISLVHFQLIVDGIKAIPDDKIEALKSTS